MRTRLRRPLGSRSGGFVAAQWARERLPLSRSRAMDTPVRGGKGRRPGNWVLLIAVLSAGIAIAAAGAVDAQQANVLVSKKVTAAPPMEPATGEAWKGARSLTVKAIGGKNLLGGSTEITLYSVYTGDTIYSTRTRLRAFSGPRG